MHIVGFWIVLLVGSGCLWAWGYAGYQLARRRPVFSPTERPRQTVSDYSVAAVCLLLLLAQLGASNSAEKRIQSKPEPKTPPGDSAVVDADSTAPEGAVDETSEWEVDTDSNQTVPPIEQANSLCLALVGEGIFLVLLALIHTVSSGRVPPRQSTPSLDAGFLVTQSCSPNSRWQESCDEMAHGVLAFLLCLPWVFLFNYCIRELTQDHSLHELLEVVEQDQSILILTLVAAHAVVMAPLLEELQFRVILQGWMADRFPAWMSVLIPAALFCSAHRFPDAFALLPLAFALGRLYHRRRSYVGVVTTHLLFNLFNLSMMLLGG